MPPSDHGGGVNTMRALLIGFVGGAVSLFGLGLAQATDGYLSAALFMFAVFVAPLTIGLAIASGVDSLRQGPFGGDGSPRLLPAAGRVRCGSCRRPMARLDVIWVCGVCDRVAVGS